MIIHDYKWSKCNDYKKKIGVKVMHKLYVIVQHSAEVCPELMHLTVWCIITYAAIRQSLCS